MSKNLGDLVWVRVQGYPDWPGVISNIEGRQLTVHFVGDNTHSFCDRDKVKAFNEVQPVKPDDWLRKSYKAALKLATPVTLDKLREVNQVIISKLEKKKQPAKKKTSKPKADAGFDERVRNAFIKLEQKINYPNDDLRRNKSPATKKSAEILSSFIMQGYNYTGQYTIDDITAVLEEITELNLSKKLLKSSELIKILKYFRAFLCEKIDPEVRKLVKMTEKLLDYFKKLLVLKNLMDNDDDDINESRDIKNELRREMLKKLSEKGFPGASGIKIMKRIESKIKEIDPSEGRVYLEKYRFILEELKKPEKLSLENFIEKILNPHINA